MLLCQMKLLIKEDQTYVYIQYHINLESIRLVNSLWWVILLSSYIQVCSQNLEFHKETQKLAQLFFQKGSINFV